MGSNADGGANGIAQVAALSSSEFEFLYDISPDDGSFSVAGLSYGFFEEASGNFIGTPANLPELITLAAQGPQGIRVKVEVKDVNQNVAAYFLVLEPHIQNFTVNLSLGPIPPGFDRTQIVSLDFVVDSSVTGDAERGLIKVKVPGIDFTPVVNPPALNAVRDDLITRGLDYFEMDTGLDAVTHFPYDNLNSDGTPSKFTQPTLIGFYMQILSEVVKGEINFNGMSSTDALNEMNTVIDSLLQVQTQHGWNGLLPFLDLDPVQPMTTTIGTGDNANLSQSLAVTIGAMESIQPTGGEQALIDAVTGKINQFLDNQASGYAALFDPISGRLRSTVNSATGQSAGFMDRMGNEFRGAIAFLIVRYDGVQKSAWDNLTIVTREYTTSGDETINTLAPFDGGAFQMFWPELRNKERDFAGFRDTLENYYAIQTDFAADLKLPGFLSASQISVDQYFGKIGIPNVSEVPDELLFDIGSTYALASAMNVDPQSVLTWLNAIEDQLGDLKGTFGFLDAARSNTEVVPKFLGIDLASTILGLGGTGGDSFETYLINRNMHDDYAALYDEVSQKLNQDLNVTATAVNPTAPPVFPDRSLAVLQTFQLEGSVETFPFDATETIGTHFNYGVLPLGVGGKFFVLDEEYDARENQLQILYTSIDTPQEIRVELKIADDTTVFTAIAGPMIDSTNVQKLIIDIPNDVDLASIKKVLILADQSKTGDVSGDFIIHSLNFQHFPD